MVDPSSEGVCLGLRTSHEELLLDGIPDGLAAYPVRSYRQGSDGEPVEVRTRRGLRKTERVELVCTRAPVALTLDASEERWLLGAAKRRWAGICSRYGEQAWARSVELVHAGIVHLHCAVDERMALGEPLGWRLSTDWQTRRTDTEQTRQRDREQLDQRAHAAACAVGAQCPELSAALRASTSASTTMLVLVCAAEDLLEGVVHAGPRAFSQAHFGHTKARDDVANILIGAGVSDDVLVALGLRRSARLGVAGPVIASIAGDTVALNLLDGPVLLRADQPELVLTLTHAVPLVIVENLQAAETVFDQLRHVALLYTAGLPSGPALSLIRQLAAQAARVLVVPDADLGGVRIAEAVLMAVPNARLVDVGVQDHPPRAAWPIEGVSVRGLRVALSGPAASLAQRCLDRGYPVEQELAIGKAVRQALGDMEA
jgi:hypothetical protein